MFFPLVALQEGGGENSLYKFRGVLEKKTLKAAALFG